MPGVRWFVVTTLVVLALPAMAVVQSQARPIVIRASTVLDGKGGVLRDVALVIDGTRIARIDSNVSSVTYDLRGLTVMPGWIDTHTHIATHFDREAGRIHSPEVNETPQQAMLYAMENAYKTFMAGFTTIQSPGAELDKDLRDWIADGRIPGPRILTSLRSVTNQTGDPSQIRAFVRKAVADGADVVKIFATASIREGGTQTMSDEQIRAACDEARTLGKRSIVHAQGPEGAKAAVLAGCTAIEHGNRLTDEVLDLMVQRGTYFDSNNHLLLHNYLENKAKYLGSGNFTEEGFAYMEKGLPLGNDTFKRALAKKVKMIFGTDGGAGAHGRNAEEIVYRVRDGGQPPMDAIVSATSLSAESLRMQDQIGSIAPGMEADIIATDGNPLQDIAAVRRVAFVMKGGKVYKNEALTGAGQDGSAVVRLDPALDDIVAPNAKVERVAGDFGFAEGPVWVRTGGYLLFSDIPANVINKWNPADDKVSVFLDKSGFTGADATGVGGEQTNARGQPIYLIGSNGVTLDPQGRVTFNAMGDRQVVRVEADGRRTVLASQYDGKRLNSTNDLVYKRNGSLYFTDPPSGLRRRNDDPRKELPFNGVFLLKGGKLQLLARDLANPNGIALSPDERILYVNSSADRKIYRFDVQSDDTVANGRILVDMSAEKEPGVPDGMKVDEKGNLYSTGAGGIWVISPQGKHLGTLVFPEQPANLAFGDAEGRTLYVTARSSLYRIRLKNAGVRP